MDFYHRRIFQRVQNQFLSLYKILLFWLNYINPVSNECITENESNSIYQKPLIQLKKRKNNLKFSLEISFPFCQLHRKRVSLGKSWIIN